MRMFVKLIILINLLLSCSRVGLNRTPELAGGEMAYDTMASDNVKASASKWELEKELCFDIALSIKGAEEHQVLASNWNAAWMDDDNRYHLIKLNQRDPASVPHGGQVIAPYGAYEEWTNTFRACIPKYKEKEVQALIMTPKNLPYQSAGSLTLKWN